jgi:glycosyltransferase involved in cell wall biosynthesis
MKQLALIVPCYNEDAVLRDTHAQLLALMQKLMDSGRIRNDSHIYYMDDGSQDQTWPLIQELSQQNSIAIGIKLSRNCGHQNAILAGLLSVEGDALITIDADLQDDLEAIPKMLDEYDAGHDVVFGVRRSRDSDTPFKRYTALAFYRFMHLMGVEVIDNHADFRLLSRRAVEHLKGFREVNLFLRGIIPLLGFPSARVYYDRQERQAGESKYPLKRMLSFAIDGITSFSMVPLRLIAIMGLSIFCITSAMSVWVLAMSLFTDGTVPGWASTVLPTYFLGGVQILCLGVIGEYLGKIYAELKARPRFIIERTTR